MVTNPNRNPVRFSVRTLLLILTATCILLAILQWVLPKDLPLGIKIFLSSMISLSIAFAVWIGYQRQHHPWKTPEDFVTVKVDAKWKRRVKSPIIMWPIAALTGVSVTFAPLYLYWCGQAEEFGVFEWIAVPLCFLMIYIVPGFYMSLATEVMAELFRLETPGVKDNGHNAGAVAGIP